MQIVFLELADLYLDASAYGFRPRDHAKLGLAYITAIRR